MTNGDTFGCQRKLEESQRDEARVGKAAARAGSHLRAAVTNPLLPDSATVPGISTMAANEKLTPLKDEWLLLLLLWSGTHQYLPPHISDDLRQTGI